MVKCGCGREAKYELYAHNEPHCLACMLEAIDCSVYVHVRRLDELEYYKRQSSGGEFYGGNSVRKA